MKVLLVEDSLSLNETLSIVLSREDYEVRSAYDGQEGLDFAMTEKFDIIILDVMMPKLSGFEVVEKMRKSGNLTPVIMLTALSQEPSKVEGLNLGADDYLAKPFSMPELLARMRAVIRTRGGNQKVGELKFGNITLKESESLLQGATRSVKLSTKECEIMKVLLEKPKFVVKKDDIISQIWGYVNDSESNSLEVFVSFLRKKLIFVDANFNINVVRGVGYQLGMK
ncbi:MAG: response regulator transcription factor [Clostridia bacterium]